MYFPKYWLGKTWLDECLKLPNSEDLSTSSMLNGPIYMKAPFYIDKTYWEGNCVKKILLEICKVLALFINTLTVDDNYSFLNRDNLTQQIQILLCKKKTHFFVIILPCVISVDPIFKILKRKMALIAYVFSKFRTTKSVVR